jgi:hypothetical protein
MEALDYQDRMQELYDHIFEPPTPEQLAEWEAEAAAMEENYQQEAAAEQAMAEDLKANPRDFIKNCLESPEDPFEVLEVRDVQVAGSKTMMDVVLLLDGEKKHWKIHYQEWAANQWDPGDWDCDVEELEL